METNRANVRAFSIGQSCLLDETWSKKEAQVVTRIAIEFAGFDELSSDEIDAFDSLSKGWYDSYFAIKVGITIQSRLCLVAAKERLALIASL